LAGWLLNVGRSSEPAACGEELGEGAAVSGVVEGEGAGAGGVSVADVGVVCGSGVVAGVISGDAVAAGVAASEGWGSGDELGVIRGDVVAAGDAVASGVVVGAGGGGVLAGWAAGAAGCCSHATTTKLTMAMGTMRYLFMPIKTDASPRRIFKRRWKRAEIQALCTIRGSFLSVSSG
jgi:hypothetical protein